MDAPACWLLENAAPRCWRRDRRRATKAYPIKVAPNSRERRDRPLHLRFHRTGYLRHRRSRPRSAGGPGGEVFAGGSAYGRTCMAGFASAIALRTAPSGHGITSDRCPGEHGPESHQEASSVIAGTCVGWPAPRRVAGTVSAEQPRVRFSGRSLPEPRAMPATPPRGCAANQWTLQLMGWGSQARGEPANVPAGAKACSFPGRSAHTRY
jgi:hypothetical protein